jgi:hypothetical protein
LPSTIIGLFERFLSAICKAERFSVKFIFSPENNRLRQFSISAVLARDISNSFVSFVIRFLNNQIKNHQIKYDYSQTYQYHSQKDLSYEDLLSSYNVFLAIAIQGFLLFLP